MRERVHGGEEPRADGRGAGAGGRLRREVRGAVRHHGDHPGTVPDAALGEGNVVTVSEPDGARAGGDSPGRLGTSGWSGLLDRRSAPTRIGFGGVIRSAGFRRLL